MLLSPAAPPLNLCVPPSLPGAKHSDRSEDQTTGEHQQHQSEEFNKTNVLHRLLQLSAHGVT